MPIFWIPLEEWADDEQRDAVLALWRGEPLRRVADALRQIEIQPLLVGGVVRDLLLSRINNDVDLIVNCRARKLMKMGVRLANLTGATPVPLDKERGTLRLCFSPDEEVDLVSLQGEDLEEDLTRRDLRINAMAVDVSGNLADPFQGREDLKNGVLREIRSENFREDPLRVIRAVRFAAQLDFILDADTITSARAASAGLEKVAGERIAVELDKYFRAARPPHIDLLRQLEALAPIFHLPDYGWTLLKEMSQEQGPGLDTGLAVLFGPCLPHSQREPLFERLKLSRKTRRFLEHWWDAADRARQMEEASLEQIFELSKVAGVAFRKLGEAVVCSAFESRLSTEDRKRIQKEANGAGELRWEPVPWNGGDLTTRLEKEPGPWLGEMLRELEKKWALKQIDRLDDFP